MMQYGVLSLEIRSGEVATPLASLLISGTQAARTASEVLDVAVDTGGS